MMMDGLLDKIIENKISPETGLNCDIDSYSPETFRMVAEQLRGAGLKSTVHAPFSDLVTGALDRRIRQVTVDRIKTAIDIADIFDAKAVVFHSGYDTWHHGEHKERFIENSLESIDTLLDHARGQGIRLVLENVYEPDPWLHAEIFKQIDHDLLGFCLDAGHAVVFSRTPPLKWLEAVGHRLAHMHVHDNMGKVDDHLPPGEGIIDFDSIFKWVKSKGLHPDITIEPHEEAYVYPALEAVGELMIKYSL